MIVNGYIRNTSGQAIPFASVEVYDGYFEKTGEGATAAANGFFQLTINENNEPYGISFSSVGYKPLGVQLSTWANGNAVTLQSNIVDLPPVVITSHKNNFPLWLLLIPVVAIAADQNKKKKISGIGEIKRNDVLLIGGGLLALGVVNKILVSLGLMKGKGGTNVSNELTNPNSCWKPAFYKAAPAGATYYTLTAYGGENYSKQIYNAFTLFKDNFDAIMSVFNQLQTKSQVSVLSEYFYNIYGRDLLTFLTDGGGIMPWDGLSDSQFLTLTTYVNRLPDYKP